MKSRWLQILQYYYKVEVEKRGRALDPLGKELNQVADWVASGFSKKPWLLLCGGVGTGKTTISKAIQSWYHYLTCGRKVFNLYTSNEISKMSVSDIANYELLFSTPRIMIDDLGTEQLSVNHYGNVLTPIVDLLYARYAERKITIISTNLSPSEICERYGERIYDRMKEMSCKVIFENKSYRDERKA